MGDLVPMKCAVCRAPFLPSERYASCNADSGPDSRVHLGCDDMTRFISRVTFDGVVGYAQTRKAWVAYRRMSEILTRPPQEIAEGERLAGIIDCRLRAYGAHKTDKAFWLRVEPPLAQMAVAQPQAERSSPCP